MTTAATVKSVQGEAFARSPTGGMRRLSAGDTIQQGEVVITSLGGQISLATVDGQTINVNSQESFKFGPESTQATAPQAGEAAVQAVVAPQGDINVEQILEQDAAAAGLGGGGENGGNSFVRLMRITEDLTPLNYEFPNPAGADLFDAGGIELGNGLPSAGDLAISLDEDDISYREGQDVRNVSWADAFLASVGSSPGGWYDNGNNDEAGGDDVPPNSPTTMVGHLNFSYGRDGVGNLQFNMPAAVLTSGGLPVQYWLSADGHTLVGYVEQGDALGQGDSGARVLYDYSGESYVKVIFSAEITDVAGGGFAFTLYGPLDHPDGGTEDNLVIPFGFTVTDGNGDTVVGTLTVNIDDDSPLVTAYASELPTLTLDESPLPAAGVIDKPQSTGNHSFASAISLDGHFGLGNNPDIQNSGTQPNVSIRATGNNAADYYAFTVTQAGSTAVFDIDYGMGHGGSFDPYIHLWNSAGVRLTYNDDQHDLSAGGSGSVHSFDSYLTYTFTQAGTYYISVGRYPGGSNPDNPIPVGGTYQLQVSLDNAIMGGAGNGDGIWTTSANFSGNFDFAFGADGPSYANSVNYALSLNGDDMGSGLYALGGDGVRGGEIMLSMVGDDIVGQLGDITYFSISVDSETGIVSFTRYQNVWHDNSSDHDDRAVLSALEGTILLTATATDRDGDSARAALDLSFGVFSIEDDGPALNGEAISQTVNEANIASAYSTGTAANEGPAVVSGGLAGLVNFGTDGMNTFGFTSTALQTLYSTEFWGPIPVPVRLRYGIETDGDVVTLTAREPDIYPGRPDSGNPVFELELNTRTGAYEFRLHDELRHTGNSGEAIDLNFGALIQATDNDGDSVLLGDAFTIRVADDVPSPVINTTGVNVQHDETPGNQPQPDDDTSSPSVAIRFTGVFGIGGVGNTGDDPDVPGTGAIGYARSGTPVVTVAGSKAGADHLASDSLSLRVIDSVSGLQTTEGFNITLSTDSLGRIIGRVDDAGAGAMNGKAAFAVALDQGGEVFVAQYLSLKHPDTGNPDDAVNLAGKIAVRYSMTDTDGDTETAQVDVGAMVSFADDGPTLSGRVISQDVHEANIGTDWSTGTDAGEGPAVISGNLAGLVNFGADGMGSFRFTADVLDQLGGLGLASRQGSANLPLSFVSKEVGGVVTITATEPDIPFSLFNPESWGNTGNWVFQLSLNQATGAYEFRLYDELVHLGGRGDVIAIDFGSMIQAVDGDGDVIGLAGKFSINVQDDAPVLANDTRSITEDTSGWISGNVLDNDKVGADHLGSFKWLDTQGKHGTFSEGSNGAYKYNLDNAAAQKLDDGETWTETFRYQVKDTDGDTKGATLTITITGANDAPTISVDTGEWSWSRHHGWQMENDVVDEAALPFGSDPSSKGEFAYGTFTVADPDGLDDIKSITINNTTFTIAELTDKVTDSVQGNSGTLTITSYDGKTGVASYKYELTKATLDVKGTETDTFTLTTSDGDATSNKATITIEIDDDRPYARPDTGSVQEGATLTVLANKGVLLNDTPGADGAAIHGVSAGSSTGSPVAGGVGVDVAGKYGTLRLEADGSYTYKSTANGVASNVVDTFVYTLRDGDGDFSTTTLKISVADSKLVATTDDVVKVYENALDLIKDGADLKAGTVTGSLGSSSTGETSGDTLSSTGGFGTRTYSLVGAAEGKYGVIEVKADGSYTYTLTKPVDTSPDNNNGPHTEYDAETFTYKVTDANGNWATAAIKIDIVDDTPTAHADAKVVGHGQTVTGNVLDNDIAGADAAKSMVSVTFGSGTQTFKDGTTPVVFDTDGGLLKVWQDGKYEYTAQPGGIDTTAETTLAGWQAKVGLYGFTDGTWTSGGKLVLGELDTAAAALVGWKGGSGSGKAGVGVGNTGNQSLGDGEHLVVDLREGTTSATLGIGQFNAHQKGAAGWNAYDSAGNLVASGSFGSAVNNGGVYEITINAATEFQYVVFDWNNNNDGYVLSGLKIQGQESVVETFAYVMQDGDGDQSSSTLTISPFKISAWNDSNNNNTFDKVGDNQVATFMVTNTPVVNTASAAPWVTVKEGQPLANPVANAPHAVELKVTSNVTFTFLSEGAGYQNTVGWYDVDNPTVGYIVWSNASAKGSGGDLVSGKSTVTVPNVPAGTNLGFFMIPDAYSPDPGSRNVPLDTGAKVYFSGGHAYTTYNQSSGNYSGKINSTDNNMTGDADPVWFSHNANPDGLQHVITGQVQGEPASVLYVGFEDLGNGGDRDYDDVVFKVDLGRGNEVSYSPVVFNLGTDLPDVALKSAMIDFTLGDGDTISWDTAFATKNGLNVAVDNKTGDVTITANDATKGSLAIEDLLDTFQINVGYTDSSKGGDYTKVDTSQRTATVSVMDIYDNESNEVQAVFNLMVKNDPNPTT